MALFSVVQAADISFRPRIEAGILDYSYKRDSVADVPLSVPSPVTGQPAEALYSRSELRFDDNVPFISVGLTLFVDRFYLDLSYLHGADSDQSFRQDTFIFDEDGDLLLGSSALGPIVDDTSFVLSADDFSRDEYSLSVGYAVSDRFAVYAGYRRSIAEADASSRELHRIAAASGTPIAELVIVRDFTIEIDLEGPFVGATYGWPIDFGIFSGVLSANAAVAFLDGEVDQQSSDGTIVSSTVAEFSGQTNDSALASETTEGDSVGVTLGLSWTGTTAVEGLTYSIGVSGYDYRFDADRATIEPTDFSETQINYRLGIGYRF